MEVALAASRKCSEMMLREPVWWLRGGLGLCCNFLGVEGFTCGVDDKG